MQIKPIIIPMKNQPIIRQFEQIANEYPYLPAVSDWQSQFNYQELNQASNRLAHYIVDKIGSQQKIGIMMPAQTNAIISILAVLKAGCAYVPIDASYPLERKSYIAQDAQLKYVISSEATDELSGCKSIIVNFNDGTPDFLKQYSINNTQIEINPADLCYVIYTSGSTGKPKGVLIPHSNLISLFDVTKDYFRFNFNDRSVLAHSLAFDFSVWEIWLALLNGAELLIPDLLQIKSVMDFYQLVVNENITILSQTPSAFNYFIEADEKISSEQNKLLALRYVIFAGEALSLATLIRWFKKHGDRQPQLINMYGITEITVHATFKRITWDDTKLANKSPIGKILRDSSAYVLNLNLNLCQPNEIGELFIAGPRLALGYLNKPELTAQRFIENPFGDGKLYRSGDLVKLLPNDEFDYIGRIDHQVKIRGYRIELNEISAKLLEIEEIKQAICIARTDKTGEKYLAAYIRLNNIEMDCDRNEIYKKLKASLPEFMLPATLSVIETFPLTPNNKIDTGALPEPMRQDYFNLAVYQSADSIITKKIQREWQKILELKEIGIEDNFFSLGGNSIKLMQLLLAINRTFLSQVHYAELARNPSIREQAFLLEKIAEQPAGALSIKPNTKSAEKSVLSFSQQSLWYVTQAHSNPAYNVYYCYEVNGKLDYDLLKNACNHIIENQQQLRVQFGLGRQGQVLQWVRSDYQNYYFYHDCSEIKNATEITNLLMQPIAKVLDLTEDPLFQLHIYYKGEKNCTLLFLFHHIIIDNWSIAIFLKTLETVYRQLIEKKPVELTSLPFQLTDFAVWQRKSYKENQLQKLNHFWQNYLKQANPLLSLPLDHERPAKPAFSGNRYTFHLPEKHAAELVRITQKYECTLFMAMLAIFSLLLSRYSNQTDILIGAPATNRQYPGCDQLIGYFLNTLIYRVPINGKQTIKEFFSLIRKNCLSVQEHQELPTEQIISLINPPRDPSYNPLFQVLLVVLDEKLPLLKLKNTEINEQSLFNHTSKFDLTLFVEKNQHHFDLAFEYNHEIFDPATIACLAGHFIQLCISVSKTPASTLSDISMLTHEEKNLLTQYWQMNAKEYPSAGLLPKMIKKIAQNRAQELAIIHQSLQLTYDELMKQSDRLAMEILKNKLSSSPIIAIYLPRSSEVIIAMLAILKIGAAYLVIDEAAPVELMKYQLEDSEVRLVITNSKLKKNPLLRSYHCISLKKSLSKSERTNEELATSEVTNHLEQMAYVIYTSGTTGKPKGILQTHATLKNLVHWQINQSLTARRIALFSPFTFDVASQVVFYSLCSAGTLYIVPNEARTDMELLWQYLAQHRIQIIFLPPAVLQALCLLAEHKAFMHLPDLEQVIVAGDVLSISSAVKKFFTVNSHCRLINHYGPSETHVATSYELPEEVKFWPLQPAIGEPIDNARIYILDSFLNPVPVGVQGEIYIGGVMLAKGYLKQPELTRAKFVNDPFAQSAHEQLYASGDVGYFDVSGTIHFIGRNDRQVQLRGYRIELDAIEAVINHYPAIENSAVLLHKTQNQESLWAHVELKTHKTRFDQPKLFDYLKQHLPAYMLPQAVFVHKKLPLTTNGKIDRKKLQLWAAKKPAHKKAFKPARSTLEKMLLNIFAKVLNKSDISIDDNFFTLGGHSLLVTELLLAIDQALKIRLSVAEFINYPTVESLAELINKGRVDLKVQKKLSAMIERDTLPKSKIAIRRWPNKKIAAKQTVLLTGANGFLGVYLLAELCKLDNCGIICLVRANNLAEAESRILSSIENAGLTEKITNEKWRVLAGDIAKPRLGLSKNAFSQLAKNVDCILHNAAWVHHLLDYSHLRASNVLSLHEILKLASTGRRKSIHFVSTMGAAVANSDEIIDENFPHFHQADITRLENGYTLSKWAAEILLANAAKLGHRIKIYRPGYITGDALTGALPFKNNHLMLFIKSCIQMSAAPADWGKLDMMPVNFVAEAIISLMQLPFEKSCIYNLNHPKPPDWSQIFSWIEKQGYPLMQVKNTIWLNQHLARVDKTNALYPLLSFYFEHPMHAEQEAFSKVLQENTLQALQQLNLKFPEITKKLITRYLNYLHDWWYSV